MPSTAPATLGLTFDDGPDPVWTPRVLEELRRAGALATFFVCAPAVRHQPRLVARILGDGHEVGFHCDLHLRHSERSREDLVTDTERGLHAVRDAGADPVLWRTPWGDTSSDTAEVSRLFGLEIVGWSADTHDWRGDAAADMLDLVSPEIRPGAIVLMHDGIGPGARRDGCAETAALVRPLVDLARSRGLEPRPLRASASRRRALETA